MMESHFNWTSDGKIMKKGKVIAHFDDDQDLIIDDNSVTANDIYADAAIALFKDGIEPDRYRNFTWEGYACLAAGYNPYDDSMTEWPKP